MKIDQSRVDGLVARPSESLNIEVKRWISADEPNGIAKIVRAAFALRNRNGGYLVIGFDDKTLQPDLGHEPADVRAAFHTDTVQGLISRYASELFEVGVAFGERDGQEYPVIVIPEGVRVPVAAKADLLEESKPLIRVGDVYSRTLAANGTPSTAGARPQDWRDIVEICFDNREADVGRFLRRQLATTDLASLGAALRQLGFVQNQLGFAESAAMAPIILPSLQDQSIALLNEGEQRFKQSLADRELDPKEKALVDAGSWSAALVIDPLRTGKLPDLPFRATLASSNPQYTGWPVWLDSSGFTDETARPKVKTRHGKRSSCRGEVGRNTSISFGLTLRVSSTCAVICRTMSRRDFRHARCWTQSMLPFGSQKRSRSVWPSRKRSDGKPRQPALVLHFVGPS
jgi:hypothetical protein